VDERGTLSLRKDDAQSPHWYVTERDERPGSERELRAFVDFQRPSHIRRRVMA
jgi:hypothetical protein